MSTQGDILRRAAQVESDAVPEPWRPSDDEDALATISDREHYRKNLVTLPDGAGEVPAYVWDFSRTPTIPNDVREEWTRGSAGRVLGPNGKYVSRGSDVPRLSFDGDEAGLLVEAAGRTNHVPYSSRINQTNWNTNNLIQSSATSVIDGKTAYEFTDDGSGDRIEEDPIGVGTFTGDAETAWCIIERGNSGGSAFAIWNPSDGSWVFRIVYDWDDGTISTDEGSYEEANARVLDSSGPNGGKLVKLIVTYSGGNTSNVNGDTRRYYIYPAFTNGDSIYAHHAQIEEAPNASSPIVTQGSPVTRAGDDYAIFEGGQPSWWNPNEGTFILEFTPRAYNDDNFNVLLGSGFKKSWVQSTENGDKVRVFDGSNIPQVTLGASEFTTVKVGVSVTDSQVILSVNGQSDNSNHTGDLLSISDLEFGFSVRSLFSVKKLPYYPRALPESTLNAITAQ